MVKSRSYFGGLIFNVSNLLRLVAPPRFVTWGNFEFLRTLNLRKWIKRENLFGVLFFGGPKPLTSLWFCLNLVNLLVRYSNHLVKYRRQEQRKNSIICIYVEDKVYNLPNVKKIKFFGCGRLCHFISDTNFGRFRNPFPLITTLPTDTNRFDLLFHGTPLIWSHKIKS